MRFRALTRPPCAAAALCTALSGCGEPLYLGSDIVWRADHESGDLSEWESDALGGSEVLGTGAGVVTVTNTARHGRHALKLDSTPEASPSGARVWRGGELPQDAFYSAWFLVPQQFWTASNWGIVKFTSSSPDDERIEGIDLELRSLAGGGYAIVVFDHNRRFLQAPLPDPPAVLEPGTWAHLSIFVRQASDDTGQLSVWLDGARVYHLEHRPTRLGDRLRFEIVNDGNALETPLAELYVDDVIISLSRVVPEWE